MFEYEMLGGLSTEGRIQYKEKHNCGDKRAGQLSGPTGKAGPYREEPRSALGVKGLGQHRCRGSLA